MMANPCRGETLLELGTDRYLVRPTFSALVSAEEEIGSLYRAVEAAAEGTLSVAQTVALLWHCIQDRPAGLTRSEFGDTVVRCGLIKVSPVVRQILSQALQGS